VANFSRKPAENSAELAAAFDDSSWNVIRPKTDGDTGEMPLKENQSAYYRAHVRISAEELNQPTVQIRFGTMDDHGWVFVNGNYIGEGSYGDGGPSFDAKKWLHAGDNVIAVGVKNDYGPGGLSPDVNVDIVSPAVPASWSRSLFNGLAQIIVQSTAEAGEIKLTATSDGLREATTIVTTEATTPRPSVP
jgi:beta-galactosidase